MSDWDFAFLAGILDRAFALNHVHRVTKARLVLSIKLTEQLGSV